MATFYWVGGSGTWDTTTTTNWSSISGAGGGAGVPTSADSVVFDANSGLGGGGFTVTTSTSPITVVNMTLTPSVTIGSATIAISSSLTVTGTLSMASTAGNLRYLIAGAVVGVTSILSVATASNLSDLDFRDIIVTGTAAPLFGTRIGDLRGNSGITFSAPKTVYWNLTGAVNWSANGWAATSGGAPNTNFFPLAQDTAIFDNTGAATTVTMDFAIPYTGSINMSARTTTMTLSVASAALGFFVCGNLTLSSNIAVTLIGAGGLTFAGRNIQTITSAGRTMSNLWMSIDSPGGTVQLADALILGSSIGLTLTSGTFNTNGYAVTVLLLASSGSNVRSLNLSSSTITCSNNTTPVNFTTTTNLTFNAGTSTVNISNASNPSPNFGALNWYNVNFTSGTKTAITMTGAATFNNFSFGTQTANLCAVTLANDITVNGTLTISSTNATTRTLLASSVIGTARTIVARNVSLSDVDFRDITCAGFANWSTSGTRLGNCGNVSGITTFLVKTVYWNLAGAQTWSAVGWATTSGGTPDINNFPLPQDTCVFDNTGSVTGIITVNANWHIGSVNMSARTTAMTLATGTTTPTIYGNWTNGTGTTLTGTGIMTFGGRGTQTVICNNISFTQPITINSSIGTVILGDAFYTSSGAAGALTLTSGTFDASNYNVNITFGNFVSSSSILKTLNLGNGTWNLGGPTTVFNLSSVSNLTVNKGTANFLLTDATNSSTRNFYPGNFVYNKLTVGGGGATGQTVNIQTASPTFSEFASTKTVAWTFGLTNNLMTLGKWSVTGSAGNIVTVTNTASAQLVMLSAPVGIDYLAMTTVALSTTSPAEFFAGANSTGTGAGITLTAAPTPRTLYWVGGSGNWDASTQTHWSLTSGVSSPVAPPTSIDDVIFDSGSNATAYTVTMTATQARCNALTINGPVAGAVTWAGTTPLAIHGNFSLAGGTSKITRTYTGAITFGGNTTGLTINTNGVALASIININGNFNAGWSLAAAITNGSFFAVYSGSFDTGSPGFNITTTAAAGNLAFSGNMVKSISLGSSTVILTGTNILNFQTTALNSTFNANTSTIIFSPVNVGTITVLGSVTFYNLIISGNISQSVSTFTLNGNCVVTGTLTINSGTNATYRKMISSDTLGTVRTLTVNAFGTSADCDFRDIAIVGAAAPISGTRFGDCGGNSGITFDTPKTVYWNLAGAQNWSATGWATTSGGTPAVNNFPLPQDMAVFDNTGSVTGIITIQSSGLYNMSSIDMSARTTAMTLATTAMTMYGNWTNGSGTTVNVVGILTLSGRGTQTITSAGKTMQPIDVITIGGTVLFADAYSASQLRITSGILTATSNMTLGNLFSASGTAVVNLGSGTWNVGAGNSWTVATTNTLNKGSANIIVAPTSTGTTSLIFGGQVYNKVTFGGGAIAPVTFNITSGGTFSELASTKNVAFTMTLNATSITVATWSLTGTLGNLITVSGTSPAAPALIFYNSTTPITLTYCYVSSIKFYSSAPIGTSKAALNYLNTAGIFYNNYLTAAKLTNAGVLQTAGNIDEVTNNPTTLGSISFNGTTQYLTIPTNTAFDLGTTFTIEFWVLRTGTAASRIISRQDSVSPFNGYNVNYNGTNYIFDASGVSISIADSNLNIWVHYAWVVNGTAGRVYINGVVSGATAVQTAATPGTFTLMNIGRRDNGTAFFPGYISNLRVVKGQALYTSNFTPSILPLTQVTGTSLLLNTPNNSDAFVDSSVNNFPITNVGAATSTLSPLALNAVNGYNSMFFDSASSQYLTVGTIGDFTFLHNGLTDYTVECWVYPTSVALLSGYTILGTSNYSANPGSSFQICQTASGDVQVNMYGGSAGLYAGRRTNGGVISVNVWNHIAWVFSASAKQFTIYVNGVSQSLSNVTAGAMTAFNYPATAQYSIAQIGRSPGDSLGGTATCYFPGYISNLRITKLQVYTGNFTVPKLPLMITQNAGTNIAAITTSTTLLTCQSSSYKDISTNLFVVTPAGATPSTLAPFTLTYSGTNIPVNRQNSNGALQIPGSFDETTLYPITNKLARKVYSNGNYFVAGGFDEVTGTA